MENVQFTAHCRSCNESKHQSEFPECYRCSLLFPFCHIHTNSCLNHTLSIKHDVFFCCSGCYELYMFENNLSVD